MAAGQGIPEDLEGFMKPTDIGFTESNGADLNNNLKMRLFPFFEMKQAYAGDPMINRAFIQLFGISNIAHLMGPNFQQMPGVILSTSIGSPPFRVIGDYEDVPFDEEVRPGLTVNEWLIKYLCGQLGMITNHLYFYRDEIGGAGWGPNWGGLCSLLDITEGTFLTRMCDVSQILNLLKRTQTHFSLCENPVYKTEAQKFLAEALNWIEEKFAGQNIKLPLYYTFILTITTLFRKFKHLHLGDAWANEPPNPDEPGISPEEAKARFAKQAEYHDYNLRIYLIRRRGRMVHESERGDDKIPVDDMVAPAAEQNLSDKMWLVMAQYYRFMPCYMKPVSLKYRTEHIRLDFPVKTLRRFVTRDGHATGSSSFTAKYDSVLFNTAAKKKGRLVMFGINPGYKHARHASLGTGEHTMVVGTYYKGKHYNSKTLGVLAGICWFFNPSMEEIFISYAELKLPFLPLRTVTIDGRNISIPDKMTDEDAKTYLPPNGYHFYVYGVDEYVLSLFLAKQMSIEARWGELNLLFYQIHWYTAFVTPCNTEYYPLLNEMYSQLVEQKLRTRGDIPLYDFLTSGGMEGWNNISLETFFSNSSMGELLHDIPTISYIQDYYTNTTRRSLLDNAKQAFAAKFPKLIQNVGGTYEYVDRNAPDCLMKYLHRYDRPFYWRNNAKYQLSQRENGTVPSNFHDATSGLIYVIQNQINQKCGTNMCKPDDEAARPTSGTCAEVGAASGARAAGRGWGGKRKTRKGKSKAKRRHLTRKR